MKSILKFLPSLICFWIISVTSSSAQDINYIPEGRYLVIGTFHIKQNAIGFTDYVKKIYKYNVTLAQHPIKNYYYVYLKSYQPGENGLRAVDLVRKETEFIDTWFMEVEPYDTQKDNITQTSSKPPVESQDIVEETTVELEEKETNASDEWVRAASPTTVKNNEPEIEAELVTTSTSSSNLSTSGGKTIPITYAQQRKYKLYFNTYYIKNFKEVKGSVDIINPKSLRLLRVAQSLELVKISDPNNGDHSVQLIANIFGYKKVQHDVKLDDPFDEVNEEFFHFKGDTLIANFPLQRYETGDIATMYNVFFFKDAAIMKANSKFELNSLVDMLKENDDLKIKIHGHTNGNSRGKVITIPEESDKFFTLNQELEEKSGTAKELSKERAEVIKSYLISYGLAADRMEVIGWGGKKPIYDKMDKLAVKNVRVEIEILEN